MDENEVIVKRNNRIEWVDAGKGAGILMVMFGHNWLDTVFCYYFYTFHMPLFFILGGYTFSAKREPKSFIWQKFKVLIIPYIIFAICNLAYYGLMSATHGGGYNIAEETVAFLLQQRHTYLWFLPVLFLSEIVVYLLYKLHLLTNIKIGGAILATLILLHYISVHYGFTDLIWNIDLVPVAAAFIIMGYIYKNHVNLGKIESNKYFIFIAFLISLMVATANFLYFGHVDMFSNKYGYYPLYIIGAVMCTYFLVLLLKAIRIPQWLISIGIASILLYGLHRIIIDMVFVLYGKAGIHYTGEDITSVIIALANVAIACLLLYPAYLLICRKMPWILGKF